MSLQQINVNGKIQTLGKRIGKGGEGEIFTLQLDNSLAFKKYTVKDLRQREKKISAMVQMGLASKTPLVAFPKAVAYSPIDGAFVGFVMQLVEGYKPLHDLYSPGSRKIHFPHADYRFLVRTAANIARAIGCVHQAGCVIGDINHSSMLVSPKATVALIDADSFQVSTPNSKFLCQVGVPEYTPPELQGQNFGTVLRTPNHDSFGLAIVIFQILFMGRHPFVGKVRSGDIPPLHENIRNFRYVYAENRNVGMDQPPGTPALSDFSVSIADAFDRAFSKSTIDKRPTAEEWIVLLNDLEKSLVKCDDNILHYLPEDASECPWCEMEKQLYTVLFVPYIPHQELHRALDPGRSKFNLELVWSQIEAVKFSAEAIKPNIKSVTPSPSPRALKAHDIATSYTPNSWLYGIASVVCLFALPDYFIIWVPIACWAFLQNNSQNQIHSEVFLQAYRLADQKWQMALENWKQRVGLKAYIDLKAELTKAREEYKALIEEEKRQVALYRNQRRQKQLHAFLDTFDIAAARIKGIGPAKEAALASYGIDTAADITSSKLYSVPGFGAVSSKPLLAWRESLERRFVYSSVENAVDRQEIAKIHQTIEAKLTQLRPKLLAGARNLTSQVSRIQQIISIADSVLNNAWAEREQAKNDLGFLNIPVPVVSLQLQPKSPVPQTTYRTQSPTLPSTRNSGAVTCPRCGSRMIQRLAKRGRNAGGYFWGCSRYPKCKGTRNI